MITILLQNDLHVGWDKATKTFSIDEKLVRFATSYELLNVATGNSKIFELSHSTGPEWDPSTKWIYKSGDLTLEVVQDKKLTAKRAEAYLDAKLDRYSE